MANIDDFTIWPIWCPSKAIYQTISQLSSLFTPNDVGLELFQMNTLWGWFMAELCQEVENFEPNFVKANAVLPFCGWM